MGHRFHTLSRLETPSRKYKSTPLVDLEMINLLGDIMKILFFVLMLGTINFFGAPGLASSEIIAPPALPPEVQALVDKATEESRQAERAERQILGYKRHEEEARQSGDSQRAEDMRELGERWTGWKAEHKEKADRYSDQLLKKLHELDGKFQD